MYSYFIAINNNYWKFDFSITILIIGFFVLENHDHFRLKIFAIIIHKYFICFKQTFHDHFGLNKFEVFASFMIKESHTHFKGLISGFKNLILNENHHFMSVIKNLRSQLDLFI